MRAGQLGFRDTAGAGDAPATAAAACLRNSRRSVGMAPSSTDGDYRRRQPEDRFDAV
jgi:hypothetical protein